MTACTLVFFRHAKPQANHAGADSTRPLCDEGRTVQQHLVKHLDARNVTPTRIYTSPFLRAVQSAKILAEHWGLPTVEEPALGADFDGDRVVALGKEGFEEGETIFFVGHEPTLAELANKLVGKDLLPAGLSKSGAVIMTFEDTIAEGKAATATVLHPDDYAVNKQ